MSDFDAMHGQEGPASEEGAGRSLGRDAAGLGLFALATLLGVSVFMSISSPADEPRGTTALFTGLSELFGPWPLFALALVLAFLGGRLWVAGVARGMVRHVAGFAAVTLALSILASAAFAGAGGTFGDWIGGGLSSVLTPFAGVPLALALLAGVVWAVWLRSPGTQTPIANVQKTAPRRAAPTDLGGLTPDEAAALLPTRVEATLERESQDGDGAKAAEAANVTGRSIQVAPDLKPLYPPDVRLQGGIPEGTRPLETRDQAQPLRARQPGRNPEPERAAPERPRAPAESLGGPFAPAAVQRTPEPHAAPPQRPAVADLAAAGTGLDAAGQHLSLPAGVSPLGEPRAARGAVPLAAGTAPLPPSWEADEDEELDVEQDVDDDAAEPTSAAAEVESLDDVDELEDEELELEDEDELEEGESEDSEELEQLELAAARGAVETVADEDEADEDEEDEGAEAAAEESALPPRPGWEQPSLFDEEPVDAYGTPTKLVDALRKSNQAAVVRLKAEPAEGELEEESELEAEDEELETAAELEADAADEDEVVEDEVDEEDDGEEGEELEESDDAADEVLAEDESDEEDTEDDEEGDDGELEDEDDEESASSEVEEAPEPEVILEPRRRARSAQPARAPRTAAAAAPADVKPAASKPAASMPAAAKPAAAKVSTVELDPESDLLFRAGALFIQRGRVAVSMLQRDFSLDFKQATALLDQLQEAGLIGPYLGGQRRDILLTLEEWRERRIGTA